MVQCCDCGGADDQRKCRHTSYCKSKECSFQKENPVGIKKYREELIQDTCQYPMNQLKIQASKVYVKGNYVCFIMLGTISNKQEEQSEDKVIAAYKSRMKRP